MYLDHPCEYQLSRLSYSALLGWRTRYASEALKSILALTLSGDVIWQVGRLAKKLEGRKERWKIKVRHRVPHTASFEQCSESRDTLASGLWAPYALNAEHLRSVWGNRLHILPPSGVLLCPTLAAAVCSNCLLPSIDKESSIYLIIENERVPYLQRPYTRCTVPQQADRACSFVQAFTCWNAGNFD